MSRYTHPLAAFVVALAFQQFRTGIADRRSS
jgi:hypothetical protein